MRATRNKGEAHKMPSYLSHKKCFKKAPLRKYQTTTPFNIDFDLFEICSKRHENQHLSSMQR